MGDTTSPHSPVGRVALFNGPPSSGKTSLVNSLQRQLPGPWFHLSLDDFRSGYLPSSWDEDYGRVFERVVKGYLGSLREMALAGNDVLAEAVIVPERRHLYETSFGAMPLLLVAVRCRFEVAVQREADRTDRRHGPIELPANYYAAVYEGLNYDLEIDTSDDDAAELARTMLPEFAELTASSFASHLR